MTFASLAALWIFPGVVLCAAISDLTTLRIGNKLVLALVAAYALLAPMAGFGLHQLGLSLAAAAVVFFFGFLFFVMGWIGGGDAKFASAIALWLGAEHVLTFVIYTALIGGGLTLVLLFFRRFPIPALLYGRPWIARLHFGDSGVPYGVALAIAALLIFPHTPWLRG